jgi:hypothetical protein
VEGKAQTSDKSGPLTYTRLVGIEAMFNYLHNQDCQSNIESD